MSDESHVSPGGTEEPQSIARVEKPPVLCREAILPKERGRGMAGVAIVCSMAGVASGLALAATLMAVQIADRPNVRASCWHRQAVVPEVTMIEATRDTRGWLGVEFVGRRDGALVRQVFAGTAAEAAGLQPGDVIRAVDGELIDRPSELQYLIRRAGPGSRPALMIDREGQALELRPMLTDLPLVIRR